MGYFDEIDGDILNDEGSYGMNMMNRMCSYVVMLGIAVLMLSIAVPTTAATEKEKALEMISRMLISMDHIQTIQCDVSMNKRTQDRVVTLNMRLKADTYGHAVAEINRGIPATFVKNKKGVFTIMNGDVRKQPKQHQFPFEIPTTFLERLAIGDITENYTYRLFDDTETHSVVDLIPVYAAKTDDWDANVVTLLRLRIDKPHFTLTKVEIFKNHELRSENVMEYRYGLVTNRVLEKKGWFKNKYREKEALALTYYKSIFTQASEEDEPYQQIKEISYSGIVLNELFDDDMFDEEHY